MTELFDGLFDDASHFPPGNSPLPEAVRMHREHREAWYSSLVGPLLVPATASADLLDVVDAEGEGVAPVRVGLIMRPGREVGGLIDAVAQLDGHPALIVSGVEMGWHPGWRDLDLHGLPMVLEVGRDEAQYVALNDIREARREGFNAIAKFRTGPTPSWVWPDEAELAEFLVNAAERSLPFKLTGGLHHLVRGNYGHADGAPEEENHGLLNIIIATAAALGAATHGAVRTMLSERRGPELINFVEELTQEQVRTLREAFTAYGCCTVTDPIGDLRTLGII